MYWPQTMVWTSASTHFGLLTAPRDPPFAAQIDANGVCPRANSLPYPLSSAAAAFAAPRAFPRAPRRPSSPFGLILPSWKIWRGLG
jgi:hypothetical protein